MIQFSVFDKDILTADDFGGETFFPLSAVPGIYHRNLEMCILRLIFFIVCMCELNVVFQYSSFLGVSSGNTSIGNYHGLKKIHMPLTFQQDKGISLNVLVILRQTILRLLHRIILLI